jgi:hypothetical protein
MASCFVTAMFTTKNVLHLATKATKCLGHSSGLVVLMENGVTPKQNATFMIVVN